jgi:uncharacterized protein with NRDE domain
MCLILFAHKAHPDYPLILAANRDEAYLRPTARAAFWTDYPHVCGGRDLDQGGTWLGITRSGSIAAITNYRDSNAAKSSTRSRGELVANYLCGNQRPGDYVAQLQDQIGAYNGFNLIAGNVDELHYLSNREGIATPIAPGVHGLSNHLLNTPWPKVERGKRILAELLEIRSPLPVERVFGMLAERTVAADDNLPETGVGLVRERMLSPAFIASATYGTRSSTVILVDNHGQVELIERTFGEYGIFTGSVSLRFVLASAPTPAAV